MIDYEILLMLDPEAPEGRHDEILARTRELIEKGGGAWAGHEPWGRRKLAYEINHKGEGTYHLLTFKAGAETLDEVTRVLKITDGVMRHMATRRPKEHRRAPASGPPPPEAVVLVEQYAAEPEEGSEGGAQDHA